MRSTVPYGTDGNEEETDDIIFGQLPTAHIVYTRTSIT